MDLSLLHLHIMLNHIPVMGAIFVLMLLAVGLARRSREITSVALAFTVLLALATVPVYLTGEPAEERIEDEAWAEKERIETHEERGELVYYAALGTGALALIGLALRRGGRSGPGWLPPAVAAALAAAAVLAALAALDGGRIRHEEIRPGASAPAAGPELTP